MIVGGEYNVEDQTVEDLQLVMTVEEELLSNLAGGTVLRVQLGVRANGRGFSVATTHEDEYILWGRTFDKKNRAVKYNLMPRGE